MGKKVNIKTSSFRVNPTNSGQQQNIDNQINQQIQQETQPISQPDPSSSSFTISGMGGGLVEPVPSKPPTLIEPAYADEGKTQIASMYEYTDSKGQKFRVPQAPESIAWYEKKGLSDHHTKVEDEAWIYDKNQGMGHGTSVNLQTPSGKMITHDEEKFFHPDSSDSVMPAKMVAYDKTTGTKAVGVNETFGVWKETEFQKSLTTDELAQYSSGGVTGGPNKGGSTVIDPVADLQRNQSYQPGVLTEDHGGLKAGTVGYWTKGGNEGISQNKLFGQSPMYFGTPDGQPMSSEKRDKIIDIYKSQDENRAWSTVKKSLLKNLTKGGFGVGQKSDKKNPFGTGTFDFFGATKQTGTKSEMFDFYKKQFGDDKKILDNIKAMEKRWTFQSGSGKLKDPSQGGGGTLFNAKDFWNTN